MRTRTRKPKLKSVRLTVEWGYESHGITISARNWSKIRRNLPVCLRGESYYYEGERFSCHWEFNGRDEPGSLVVGYGDDGAEGYVGEWKDAEIMEVHEAPPKPAEVTSPSRTSRRRAAPTLTPQPSGPRSWTPSIRNRAFSTTWNPSTCFGHAGPRRDLMTNSAFTSLPRTGRPSAGEMTSVGAFNTPTVFPAAAAGR